MCKISHHCSNLVKVWDGYIVYADAGVSRFSNLAISPFMEYLLSRIRSDSFPQPTHAWLKCIDPGSPVECAMSWAQESNAWTCDYVYNHNLNNTDLLTSGYAVGAFPIVELQISKAALRLGTWLNILASGSYNTEQVITLQTSPRGRYAHGG
jgi:hypothetical protein